MVDVRNPQKDLDDTIRQDTTLNTVPCGLCRVALDTTLNVLEANDRFYALFRYTRPQALQAGFTSLCFILPETDLTLLLEDLHRALAQHQDLFEKEVYADCRNGLRKAVLMRCYLQRSPQSGLLWSFMDLTRQKQMQRKVRLSEEMCKAASRQFHTILGYYDLTSHSLTFVYTIDSDWEFPSVLYDLPDSILGSDLLTPSSKRELRRFFDLLNAGKPFGQCVLQARKSLSSHFLWFCLKYVYAPASDNMGAHAIITIQDITAEREKEIAYEKWLQNYAELRHDCTAYFECDLTDDHLEKIESSSRVILEMCSGISTYSGLHAHAAFHLIYVDDKNRFFQMFTREHLLSVYYTGQYRASLEFRYATDTTTQPTWYSVTAQLVSDPYVKSVRAFLTVKNIDAEKREQLQLEKSSQTDSLTGLLNRRTLTERVCQALLVRSECIQAFVIVDLDHFKHINDSNGHQFGDKVIKDVSEVLQACAAPTDICGRLGGDEFVLFLQNIPTEKQLAEQISMLSAHICHRYANGISVSACMGVALVPTAGATFEELYKKSDTALYHAKHIGAGNYVFADC